MTCIGIVLKCTSIGLPLYLKHMYWNVLAWLQVIYHKWYSSLHREHEITCLCWDCVSCIALCTDLSHQTIVTHNSLLHDFGAIGLTSLYPTKLYIKKALIFVPNPWFYSNNWIVSSVSLFYWNFTLSVYQVSLIYTYFGWNYQTALTELLCMSDLHSPYFWLKLFWWLSLIRCFARQNSQPPYFGWNLQNGLTELLCVLDL